MTVISGDCKPGTNGFEAMGAQIYRDSWQVHTKIVGAAEQGVYVPHIRSEVVRTGGTDDEPDMAVRIWPHGAVLTVQQAGDVHRVDTDTGGDPNVFVEIRKTRVSDRSFGSSLIFFVGNSANPEGRIPEFYPHDHPQLANVLAGVLHALNSEVVRHAIDAQANAPQSTFDRLRQQGDHLAT